MKASDTIGSLMSNIQGKERVPFHQQSLFYAGIQLDYRQRLSDLEIPVNTPHHLVLRRRGPLKISVKCTTNGRKYTYEVEASDTVQSVKEKIQDKQSIHLETFSLLVRRSILTDDKTLAYYNISEYEIIYLQMSPRVRP